MVRDLLREIVGEAWVDFIDFDSAEKVDASFVSEKRKRRKGISVKFSSPGSWR